MEFAGDESDPDFAGSDADGGSVAAAPPVVNPRGGPVRPVGLVGNLVLFIVIAGGPGALWSQFAPPHGIEPLGLGGEVLGAYVGRWHLLLDDEAASLCEDGLQSAWLLMNLRETRGRRAASVGSLVYMGLQRCMLKEPYRPSRPHMLAVDLLPELLNLPASGPWSFFGGFCIHARAAGALSSFVVSLAPWLAANPFSLTMEHFLFHAVWVSERYCKTPLPLRPTVTQLRNFRKAARRALTVVTRGVSSSSGLICWEYWVSEKPCC